MVLPPDLLKAWQAQEATAKLFCIFDARESAWERACLRQWDLKDAIASYRAVTIDGIIIKKRSIAAYKGDQTVDVDESNDTISYSIDRDLRLLDARS
jgi:hypothetical protein